MKEVLCPICHIPSCFLDAVDFNKSCLEQHGQYAERLGVTVDYFLCPHCGFCFCPDMGAWSKKEFEEKVYNADYCIFDPQYLEERPRLYLGLLTSMFGSHKKDIMHLDYGGGQGLLSKRLRAEGWISDSYDPFVDTEADYKKLRTYNFITVIEVFEHVPDINALMMAMQSLLVPDGIILFSTLLSDGRIHKNRNLDWWYAAPRNGHISLFSRNSLELMAHKYGFNLGSFSDDLHLLFTNLPAWALHLMDAGA